ncbi:MAG TPA: tetratricopeptide repeat protein [Thermoanaerobaculia bacterium]|nr:tetratricopeptide repeat protein [Thermoanaerobaculia bacterium]
MKRLAVISAGLWVLVAVVVPPPLGGGAVGSGGGQEGGSVSLLPIPEPDTSLMEPAVREQLEAERQAFAGASNLADAYGRRGRAFLVYELADAARACFENATRLAPSDPRWPYYLGVIHQKKGDFAAAAASFARTLELRPQDAPALLRLGEVDLQRGDLAAARRRFEAALPLPGAAAAAHFGLGRVALGQDDATTAATAARHLETALGLQPGSSVVRYQLALAYRKLGQTGKARQQLSGYDHGGDARVRFADPLMSEVAALNAGARGHVVLATSAFRAGRFAEAAAEYRKALEGNPDDPLVWGDLGTTLERLGDAAGAEQSYRRALELAPEDGRARQSLGTLLASRGRAREGIEHLEAAVRLLPGSRDARFNLARALAETGEPTKALEQYDQVLALAPQDLGARYQKGMMLLALGRPGDAVAELDRVAADDPAAVAPRAAAAAALAAAGRFPEAAERQRQAVDLATRAGHPGVEGLRECLVMYEAGKVCEGR